MSTFLWGFWLAWVIAALRFEISRLGEKSKHVRNIESVFERLELGMDLGYVVRLVGQIGREDISKDAAGTWHSIYWQGRTKTLRTTFHNDRLVDWAIF